MSRTVGASVLAALIAFVSIGGLGVFLGFGAAGSWITGAVCGVLAGLLIWGASRRADSFHPLPDPTDPADPTDPTGSTDSGETP